MIYYLYSSVNWLFLSAICIAKSLVFLLVATITLLVHRPIDFSKAGLFAIFCTQSNDFALGYPICMYNYLFISKIIALIKCILFLVAALYSKTHPEYAAYLYLMAPISLVFLNPIGFVLMEVSK